MNRTTTILSALLAALLLAAAFAGCAQNGKTPAAPEGAGDGTTLRQTASKTDADGSGQAPDKDETPVDTAVFPDVPTAKVLSEDGLTFRIYGDHAAVLTLEKRLKKAEIPAQIDGIPVTEVAPNGFKNQAKLTTLTLPEGLVKIGESAFEGCTALTEVILPESLTSLGENAFSSCKKLSSLQIGHRLETLPYHCFALTALTAIEIPEGVKVIEKAFSGDFVSTDARVVITLPSTIEKLDTAFIYGDHVTLELHVDDYFAVFDLPSSRTVEAPDSVPDGYGLPTEQTVYFQKWSCGCAELYQNGDRIVRPFFPQDCAEIPAYCFYRVAFLESALEVPEGITAIGDYAFTGSTFEEIDLPSTVVTIGTGAFKEMKSLRRVDVKEGLESIGGSAFEGSPIEEIYLPSTLTVIYPKAFKDTQIAEIATCAVSLFDCFSNMPQLKKLTLLEGVYNFQGVTDCPLLESVSLPGSLGMPSASILYHSNLLYEAVNGMPPADYFIHPVGEAALFKRCPMLTNVTISPDCKYYAFENGRIVFKDFEIENNDDYAD